MTVLHVPSRGFQVSQAGAAVPALRAANIATRPQHGRRRSACTIAHAQLVPGAPGHHQHEASALASRDTILPTPGLSTAHRHAVTPAALTTPVVEVSTSRTRQSHSWLSHTSVSISSYDHQEQQYTTTVTAQQRLQSVTFGVAKERGPGKPEMQDRHVVVQHVARQGPAAGQPIAEAQPSILAGVFDGHGGSSAAQRAANLLSAAISQDQQIWNLLANGAAHSNRPLAREAVEGLQAAMSRLVRRVERDILDEDRTKLPHLLDGTTALMGLQVGHNLVLINIGDCRAVLCRGGTAVRLTCDHKPGDERERQRIQANGGHVRLRNGSWRVVLDRGAGMALKVCNVSRTLGDLEFKSPHSIISCEPDVFHVSLCPGQDQLVIYASDGVWAALSDQDAVDVACAAYTQASQSGMSAADAAQAAATALLEQARARGSTDDITVVVTPFTWAAA